MLRVLADYLKALRDEVKKRRSGGEVEDESVTSDDAEGSVEEEPEQREEPEPVVEADGAERIEQVEEPEEVERVEVEEPVPGAYSLDRQACPRADPRRSSRVSQSFRPTNACVSPPRPVRSPSRLPRLHLF